MISKAWSWKRTPKIRRALATGFVGILTSTSAVIVSTIIFFTQGNETDRSQAMEARPELPLGLPKLLRSSLNQAKVDLGRKLFFDRRLSFNGTMSCAMCHIPTEAFASTQSSTSIGMEGRTLPRNAPSLLNVTYQNSLFWDGRESDLATQPWSPLLSPIEMGNPSVGYLVDHLRRLGHYANLFQDAFGELNMETIGEALAEYERSLLSGNSRFDRWKYGGEANALSAIEKRGFELFSGKAGCSSCHLVTDDSALFTDMRFHATGVGYKASVFAPPQTHNVELEPGVITVVADDSLKAVSEIPHNDLGRFAITLNPSDRWAYKTPSLRNVALTHPYMHDGSLKTLEDVVEFYDRGGVDFEGKSALIRPLRLTEYEKKSLVAFLETLTGDQQPTLDPPTGTCMDLGAAVVSKNRDPRCGDLP